MGKTAGELKVSSSPQSISPKLRQAKKIIERDYRMPITMLRLARWVQMPQLGFVQAYTNAFGIGPQEHLCNVRARAAARLLAEGMNPEAVTKQLGYWQVTRMAADYRLTYKDRPAQLRLLERWTTRSS